MTLPPIHDLGAFGKDPEKQKEDVPRSDPQTEEPSSPAVSESSTIRTLGLVKRFGDREVVRKVSLEMATGEVVGILGPNGAGKDHDLSRHRWFAQAHLGRNSTGWR